MLQPYHVRPPSRHILRKSTPGTWQIMEQAGEQRARGRVEDCLDTLNILVAFLEPIEKEVKLLWRAVRAHEKPKKRATE